MANRSHYLPPSFILDVMSNHDRAMMLDAHLRDIEAEIEGHDARLRDIEAEIEGLESGYITATKGGKAYQLKLSRARRAA